MKYCSRELQKWRNSNSFTIMQDQPALPLSEKVKEMEIACIKDALHKTSGKKLQASKLLGITRQGLDKKLRRYKISESSKSSK